MIVEMPNGVKISASEEVAKIYINMGGKTYVEKKPTRPVKSSKSAEEE